MSKETDEMVRAMKNNYGQTGLDRAFLRIKNAWLSMKMSWYTYLMRKGTSAQCARIYAEHQHRKNAMFLDSPMIQYYTRRQENKTIA